MQSCCGWESQLERKGTIISLCLFEGHLSRFPEELTSQLYWWHFRAAFLCLQDRAQPGLLEEAYCVSPAHSLLHSLCLKQTMFVGEFGVYERISV